jgi:hypothetical protein
MGRADMASSYGKFNEKLFFVIPLRSIPLRSPSSQEWWSTTTVPTTQKGNVAGSLVFTSSRPTWATKKTPLFLLKSGMRQGSSLSLFIHLSS